MLLLERRHQERSRSWRIQAFRWSRELDAGGGHHLYLLALLPRLSHGVLIDEILERIGHDLLTVLDWTKRNQHVGLLEPRF